MNPPNLETGKIGEKIARRYLEENGYKILEQNYKTKYAEIDLIAKKKNEMIFVEVRTKRGEDFGAPEETINKKKLRKLWGNARAYTAWKKWRGPYRVDAICIVLKPSGRVDRLNHYQNIVLGLAEFSTLLIVDKDFLIYDSATDDADGY